MRKTLDALQHSTIANYLRRPVVGYGLVFLVGFIFFGFYAVRLGCDVSWDLKNYHYYTPYALLNGRIDFDYAPAQVQTYLNPISFVPFYLASTHLEPVQTGYLLGGIHGLSFGLLFMLGYMLFASARGISRFALALACAIMGTAGPLFMRQLGTSYNDILIVPLALIALLFYVRDLRGRSSSAPSPKRKALVLSGLLMGIAAGLKLVFAVWLIGFAVGVFVVERGWAGRIRASTLLGAASVVGLLISRGYWMALLWSEFGSPLFPFYNKVFKSPLYYDHTFSDRRFLPENAHEVIRLPFETSDGRLGVFLGVVALSALIFVGKSMWSRQSSKSSAADFAPAPPGETRACLFLAVFLLAGIVVWEAQFSIARYVVPLEMLAPLGMVALLRASTTRRRPAVLAALALGAALVVLLQPVRVDRTAWHETLFSIDAPHFENPETTLVILADDEPMSYVIPFFQPEVRFVCPWNNFTRTEDDEDPPLIVQEMVDVIQANEGPLFAIAPHHLQKVRSYGVSPPTLHGRREFDAEPLSPTRLSDTDPPPSGLYLWKLVKVPAGKWKKK